MFENLIQGLLCDHEHSHGGEVIHELLHEVGHAFMDTVKLLPLLFLAYLLMEYLEHHENGRLSRALRSSRKAGPVFGSLFGLVPQCGFSGAAASLYAGGTISTGTLLAVFLATSDEMLPILISSQMPFWKILLILGMKLVCGCVAGLTLDFLMGRRNRERSRDIHDFCQQENCSCEGSIFMSALRHTVKIALLIFVVMAAVGVLFLFVPREALTAVVGIPVLGEVIAALIGLVPNCASSVMITNFYTQGVIGAGPMFSGLLVNAGVGLLVLFRVNRNRKENLYIVGILFASGIVLGTVLGFLFERIL